MGLCKYCHQEVGFLGFFHVECMKKHLAGKTQVLDTLNYIFSQHNLFDSESKNLIDRVCRLSYIDNNTLNDLYIDSFTLNVDKYLEDGFISSAEKSTIDSFIRLTNLSQNALNKNYAVDKLIKADILDKLINGNVIPTYNIPNLGVMISRNERPVYCFRNVVYLEEKIKREYVGGSSGVSIRICKGVYYRTGTFKGHPIEKSYMNNMGTGTVCLTDKNFYFISSSKSIKIPYSKIVNILTYKDGIGIQKDVQNPKKMIFQGVDSWFTYNVIAYFK